MTELGKLLLPLLKLNDPLFRAFEVFLEPDVALAVQIDALLQDSLLFLLPFDIFLLEMALFTLEFLLGLLGEFGHTL